MSAPVIDSTSNILSFPQWQPWEHYFAATNAPYAWAVNAGGFPSGMVFQPNFNGMGDHTTGVIDTGVDHGLALGNVVIFSAITWSGSGLSINTIYYVAAIISSHEIKLATTPGGASLSFTADFTVSNLVRPGYLKGAGDTPGTSLVTLQATNGSGASAEVTFTIGIEAAAAVPDSNADMIWDFATNNIIAQTSGTFTLTPEPDPKTPILYVKEKDDLIVRLRMVKSGTILDLGPLAEVTDLALVLKELEPESKVVVSDVAAQFGTGPTNSYPVHALIDGVLLKASLSNYEDDAGTFYDALGEFEITFATPYGAFGPGTIHRTSRTFRVRIERDLGE